MLFLSSALGLCLIIVLIDPGVVTTAEDVSIKKNITKTTNSTNVTLESRFFDFGNPFGQLFGGNIFGPSSFGFIPDRLIYPNQVGRQEPAEQQNPWNGRNRYPNNGRLPIQQQYPIRDQYPSQVQYPNDVQYPGVGINRPTHRDQGINQGTYPVRSEYPYNYPNQRPLPNQQVQYPADEQYPSGRYPDQANVPVQYPNTQYPYQVQNIGQPTNQGRLPDIEQYPAETQQYPNQRQQAQYLNQGNVPVQEVQSTPYQQAQYPNNGYIPPKQLPNQIQTPIQGALPDDKDVIFTPDQFPEQENTPVNGEIHPNPAIPS